MKKEYVLRELDAKEIERLKFQHQVWREETNVAIKKSDVKTGDKIIDLGSGPGYLSFDLIPIVGQKGKIFCLDNSEKFLSFIESKGIRNINTIKADIRDNLSELSTFKKHKIDKVFCRWVLMFVDNVEGIIEEVYKLLDNGGKFISMEYFRFEQIDIFPHSNNFDNIYKNVKKLLIKNGGNPDVGSDVFKIMENKGFKNIQTHPIYRSDKSNSPLWNWLEKTNKNHKNLVDSALITHEELESYYADWQERSKRAISFITAPPLMITIGEK